MGRTGRPEKNKDACGKTAHVFVLLTYDGKPGENCQVLRRPVLEKNNPPPPRRRSHAGTAALSHDISHAAGGGAQSRPSCRPYRGAMQALPPVSRPSVSFRTAIVSRGFAPGRVVFRSAEDSPGQFACPQAACLHLPKATAATFGNRQAVSFCPGRLREQRGH